MKNQHYLFVLVLMGMQIVFSMDNHSHQKESNADRVALKAERWHLEFIYSMAKQDEHYGKAFRDLQTSRENPNHIISDSDSLTVLTIYNFLDANKKVKADISELMKTMPKK